MALLKRKSETRRGLVQPSKREMKRPEPDEAPLDKSQDGPAPKPELHEPGLRDPGLRDLSFADYKAIVIRAGKEFMADNCMMLASALAYSSFFAIPSTLLVVVGLFTLIAGPETINSLIQSMHGVIPGQASQLLNQSLHNADAHPGGSIVATALGFVLAVWAVTGAMNSYMTALNLAYNRKDRRTFVTKRVVALKMAAIMGVAFLLVAVLLMFGPVVEGYIASHAGSGGIVVSVLWWVLQWPILLGGLLVAFATLLFLGPD